MDIRRIEEASLNTWPALRQILYDGWIMRFAGGYTKRANSITPVYNSTLPVEDKIRYCESMYVRRGLPTVFRITPLADSPNFDERLHERGYEKIDVTSVQTCSLAAFKPQPTPNIEQWSGPLDEWVMIQHWLSGKTQTGCDLHRQIIERILGKKIPLAYMQDGEMVACGLAVVEGNYVGLYDFATANRHRNKGYAAEMARAAIQWGIKQGATTAYLQVMTNNAPANALYKKESFVEAYRYWYRIKCV